MNEYEYHSASQTWSNTNTNIIRLPRNDWIQIRILFSSPEITESRIQISFGFPIMTKYEYHSASQKWSNTKYANTNFSQHFTFYNINASKNTSLSSLLVDCSLELEKELQKSNFLRHSPIRCCLDTWTGLYRLLLSDFSLLVRRNVRFTANNWQEFGSSDNPPVGTCSLVAGTNELAMLTNVRNY